MSMSLEALNLLLDLESESESEEVVLIYPLAKRGKNKRSDYLAGRNIYGEFNLLNEVPENVFNRRFRLMREQFREVHELIKTDITGRECNAQKPIGSEEKLAVCLTVYKKSSPNNKLTLYLGTRDLIISNKCVDKIQGVVLCEPQYLQNRKIFGQVTLTFRYGREDEEVMGLKFCNEAVMCLAQLYPPHERAPVEPITPLQEALVKRLGPNAHPFTMTVTHLAPPSVQLVPAKEYSGAPIGTSYDVRAYAAERADEKLHRRSTVRMGIRVVQMPRSPGQEESPPGCEDCPPPQALAEKQFILSDGKLRLQAALDKAVYHHGDPVIVSICLRNGSNKTVRRLKAFIVQHVDVCMFSNGKFKNVVAMTSCLEKCEQIGPGGSYEKCLSLRPVKGATKNWIALEDSYSRANPALASTVLCASPEERNVFAIYVSYYVKVKAWMGAIGGDVSVKLPFVLMHSPSEPDPTTQVVAPTEATPPDSPRRADERERELRRAEEEELTRPEDEDKAPRPPPQPSLPAT